MITDMRPSYLRAFFLTGLMAATLLIAGSAGPTSPSQPTLPAQKAQIARDYGKLPFSFEANTGQADQRVKFLARGSGYGLYLTGDEAVLTLKTGRQNAKGKSQNRCYSAATRSARRISSLWSPCLCGQSFPRGAAGISE